MAPFLSWLFGGEPPRQPPPRVPTDTVIKLGVMENSLMMKSLYMNWTFRVDDALDINMLRTSLEDLITTAPNWRKLGGRFRRTADGNRLELHIPSEFSPARPAVQFTHETYDDRSVQDHPLDAGTLPHCCYGGGGDQQDSSSRPAITDGPEQLDDLLAGPTAPRGLDDWLYTDTPALVVHAIRFADATFLTLTYSHSLVDGVGKREIVTNWCRVLAGTRPADVAPLAAWGNENDDAEGTAKAEAEADLPMAVLGRPWEAGEERYLHEAKQLTGWRKWYWVFRFLWERLANGNHYRQRNLVIPASTMARIRERSVEQGPSADGAKEEPQEAEGGKQAAAEQPSDRAKGTSSSPSPSPSPSPYLSDNQLLTTWLVRLACLPLQHTNRPLGISSAVDLRGFFSQPSGGGSGSSGSSSDKTQTQTQILQPGTVYLQNLLAYTWINTTPAQLLRAPLGAAAAHMRAALKPQLTGPQVRAAARLTYAGIQRSGTVDFFVDSKDTYTVSVSSLAKAKYWETIDFGPAVVKVGGALARRRGRGRGRGRGDVAPGRLVWQSSTPRSRLKPSCLIVIQGQDLQGNWFAQMVLSQRAWDMVERELAKW